MSRLLVKKIQGENQHCWFGRCYLGICSWSLSLHLCDLQLEPPCTCVSRAAGFPPPRGTLDSTDRGLSKDLYVALSRDHVKTLWGQPYTILNQTLGTFRKKRQVHGRKDKII